MRRLKCRYILLVVFVLLSSVFGLNQAKAVELTQLVQYIGTWNITHSPLGTSPCQPRYSSGGSLTSSFWFVINTSEQTNCDWSDQVLSLEGLGFNDRYIFQLDYYFYDIRDKEELNAYANQPPNIYFQNGRFPINYIGTDVTSVDDDSGIVSFYFNIPYTNSLSSSDRISVISNIGLQTNEIVAMSNKMSMWSYYTPSGGGNVNVDLTQVINAINNIRDADERWDQAFATKLDNIYSAIQGNNQNIDSIDQTLQDQAEKDDEDRENIEEQREENQDDADDAGSEATSTGTSLFSAFTQLLGALTNISGNDCRLPNIQVYSLNLGSMDLCTYTIPPQIMALVSIGMVFIIVPLGIHLVKKMIALYKEITG